MIFECAVLPFLWVPIITHNNDDDDDEVGVLTTLCGILCSSLAGVENYETQKISQYDAHNSTA